MKLLLQIFFVVGLMTTCFVGISTGIDLMWVYHNSHDFLFQSALFHGVCLAIVTACTYFVKRELDAHE